MHGENISEHESELIEPWKKMKDFGDWLMRHGINCATNRNGLSYEDRIFEQRVGFTLVHQAAEILMKSYLISKSVNIVERKNRKGRDITMTFMKSIGEINKKFEEDGFDKIDETKFDDFDEFRNEIYHRSFEIPWEKDTEIQNFLSEFRKFYEKGFREILDAESEAVKHKFSKIHS